jgi:hypothetical protein
MNESIKQRIAPFVALLDAKYMPLLFAVAPQAYSVYLWLFPKPYDVYGESFAVMGALGFEWVYVGAIAWAEEGKSSKWTWVTAIAALIFSVLVAYHVHEAEGAWAWLHAGFPIVAFAYTINMYLATKPQPKETPTEQVTVSPDPVWVYDTTVTTPQPESQPTGKLAGVDVAAVLEKHGGNKTKAANELRVSAAAIYKWLARNGA